MTRLFYSPERSAPGSSDFDPVREGAAYRLAPEVALAIGERACAEATDSAGRRDEALVRRRFHELATRIAARGGRLMRDVGRLTRVEMEIEGIAPDALDEPLAVRAPGRDTRVAEQARRLARLEGGSEPAVASRASELPGASAVAQAMAALGMSTVAGPSGASRARSAPAGGLPLELRLSMEALTGIAMDDVRVSYNSRLPARLHAAAVTNGREIHLGPGHDHHLPHEAWHVVQQKQGRVAATVQGRGWQVNDDRALEREADVMGARAAAYVGAPAYAMAPRPAAAPAGVYQLAPLGEVEHIRNSCYIAAILHTFTVTKSLRNLLDPAANQIAGPIAALQDLLHRAVNTVDQNALVDATWVAAIMTAMVAAGIVPDAEAQDVNGVTVALVGALQQGNAAAAQTNGRDAYTFAAWGGGGIPAALGQQGFDGDSLGNVVHLNRAPYNHDQAPTSFQFPGGTDLGPVTYHLRAVANRDVGSYDQAHFIAYANRGAPEAPEWHENDDVGPRRRPIADLANVQTDPAMLQRLRKQLNEHGVTDDVIEKSKNLSNAVAPKPIDVLGGAVMYVYEREAIDPVAAVDGGARTLTGGNPPDTSGFRGAYYQMLFDKRKGLSLETRSALLDVLEDGKGFEKEVKTLRTEMAQAIAAELESAIAQLLGLSKAQVAALDQPASSGDETVSLEDTQQALIATGAERLRAPKGGKADRVSTEAADRIGAKVRKLVSVRDAAAIARFTPDQLMVLQGWEQMPLQFSTDSKGNKSHVQKKDLIAASKEFLQHLNFLLDDELTQTTLDPEAYDRLLAIHMQLGADATVGGGRTRVRAQSNGVPAEKDVTIDKQFKLFEPTSESELEDEPVDVENQAEMARTRGRFNVFSTATFGNHNPQPLEGSGITREQLTGLGHSNTTAMLVRGGQFVPRTTGPVLTPKVNAKGHRRALGKLGGDDDYGKDTPHAKLDKLAAEHQKKYESDLKRPRKVFEQSGNDRRTMRHILSGSLMWTEQSKLYPGEEATELEAARSELDVDEKTPSGHVLKRHRVATQEACDHAESQLLRTQLWLELTRRVIQMVVAEGEGHGTLDDRTLQLLLNRSNCEGCAGRLIAEAIRIWTQLGLACVEPIADWRQVRDRFRGELRLIVSFSGNYHQDDLPRFQELCLGLTDAGWIVNLLPRNRTTDELTRKTTATLGAIDKMISSRSDKADELRRYFMISEKLRLTTGAQVPEPSSSKVETHDQEMHDESIEPIGEQVEDAKVERDRFGLPGGRLRKPDAS